MAYLRTRALARFVSNAASPHDAAFVRLDSAPHLAAAEAARTGGLGHHPS